MTECYAMVLNVYLKIALWVTLCEYVLETDACMQKFFSDAFLIVAITSCHTTCADTVPTKEDVKRLYNSVGVILVLAR